MGRKWSGTLARRAEDALKESWTITFANGVGRRRLKTQRAGLPEHVSMCYPARGTGLGPVFAYLLDASEGSGIQIYDACDHFGDSYL